MSASPFDLTEKPQVRYLHIDVTVLCNLKCTYCYYSDYNTRAAHRNEVEFERLRDVILEAKALGCTRVIFSGGEVFLSEKTVPLLYLCADSELEIVLITNGTLVDDRELAALLRVRRWIHEIKVSYDGASHRSIRGAAAESKTLQCIEEFDACGLPWTVNTILTKGNVEHLHEIYDFLAVRGPKAWRMDLPFLQGSYVRNRDSLAVDDLDALFRALAAVLNRYLAEEPSFELWMFTIYRPGLERWDFTRQELHMHPCTYNKRNIAIRGNGEVTPCSRLLSALGNVQAQTLSEARSSVDFNAFWDMRIGDLPECSSCRYVFACGGGCRAHAFYEYGDLGRRDPMACEIMPRFEQHILPMFSPETQASFRGLVRAGTERLQGDLDETWRKRESIGEEMRQEAKRRRVSLPIV